MAAEETGSAENRDEMVRHQTSGIGYRGFRDQASGIRHHGMVPIPVT